MRRAFAFAPLLASVLPVALSACGGGGSAPPQDQALEQNLSAGRTAMANRTPDQAVPRFADAYRRALARDDAQALADAGYDLAAAHLAADAPDAALADIARTRADLVTRGRGDTPALDLVEAGAWHRTGRDDRAAASAARAEASPEAGVRARAAYIAGVAADARGDVAGLRAARARLLQGDGADKRTAKEHAADWQRADAAELDARLALRLGQPQAARRDAEAAAALRRTRLDYRGMRTALALAAQACRASGDDGAAAAFDRQIADSRDAAAGDGL